MHSHAYVRLKNYVQVGANLYVPLVLQRLGSEYDPLCRTPNVYPFLLPVIHDYRL